MKLTKYSKAIVAFLVVVVAGGIAQGLIAGSIAAWLNIILGAVATVGVTAMPNKDTKTP